MKDISSPRSMEELTALCVDENWVSPGGADWHGHTCHEFGTKTGSCAVKCTDSRGGWRVVMSTKDIIRYHNLLGLKRNSGGLFYLSANGGMEECESSGSYRFSSAISAMLAFSELMCFPTAKQSMIRELDLIIEVMQI